MRGQWLYDCSIKRLYTLHVQYLHTLIIYYDFSPLLYVCSGPVSVFIGVSERQETETNIRQLKEKKKNEKDLDKYRKWIQKSCIYVT